MGKLDPHNRALKKTKREEENREEGSGEREQARFSVFVFKTRVWTFGVSRLRFRALGLQG